MIDEVRQMTQRRGIDFHSVENDLLRSLVYERGEKQKIILDSGERHLRLIEAYLKAHNVVVSGVHKSIERMDQAILVAHVQLRRAIPIPDFDYRLHVHALRRLKHRQNGNEIHHGVD